jgi:putative ABC transport system permease protein
MTDKKRFKSPGLAKKLLSLLSAYHEKHSIIEDFEETFSEITRSERRFKAEFWYWSNTIKSVLGYLKMIMAWRFTIFRNHLKIAYRNFASHKLYSFINVSGLAIGLSICMIISLWVLRELSYDRWFCGSGDSCIHLHFPDCQNGLRQTRRQPALRIGQKARILVCRQ